ncbi:hypothetical protein H375_6730 [Rickettsia prowazekii str. Breinl]|nr:hypothetical protein H375_6730 [Rickettsia prowazekii str. Breinl]
MVKFTDSLKEKLIVWYIEVLVQYFMDQNKELFFVTVCYC